MKNILNFNEFRQLKEVKHRADLDVGDIIYLSCGTNFKQEDNQYHKVVCDFRCGKDDFAGERHDGRRASWFDMDHYTIVGKQISIL